MRLETLLASTLLDKEKGVNASDSEKKFARLTDDRITLTVCVFSNTGQLEIGYTQY